MNKTERCQCGKIPYPNRLLASKAKRFFHREKVKEQVLEPYKCAFGAWHIGHPLNYRKHKKFKVRRDAEDLLIVRNRVVSLEMLEHA
jgi:hypothetical protein